MLEDARVEVAKIGLEEKKWECFEVRLGEVRRLRIAVLRKELKEMGAKSEVDGELGKKGVVAEEEVEDKEKEEEGKAAEKEVNEEAQICGEQV